MKMLTFLSTPPSFGEWGEGARSRGGLPKRHTVTCKKRTSTQGQEFHKDKTWYASAICLNICSALGLFGFLSGCH